MKQRRSRRATRLARRQCRGLPLRWGCGARDTAAYRQVSLDHWLRVAQLASLACRHWFRRTTRRISSVQARRPASQDCPSPPIPSEALASVAICAGWQPCASTFLSFGPLVSTALVERFPFFSRVAALVLLLLLREPFLRLSRFCDSTPPLPGARSERSQQPWLRFSQDT